MFSGAQESINDGSYVMIGFNDFEDCNAKNEKYINKVEKMIDFSLLKIYFCENVTKNEYWFCFKKNTAKI